MTRRPLKTRKFVVQDIEEKPVRKRWKKSRDFPFPFVPPRLGESPFKYSDVSIEEEEETREEEE